MDVLVDDMFLPVPPAFRGDEQREMGNDGLLNPFLDGIQPIGLQIEVQTYTGFFSKEILDAVEDVRNDVDISLEDTGIKLIP